MSDPVMTLPNGDVLRIGDYGKTRDGRKVKIEGYDVGTKPWFCSDHILRCADGGYVSYAYHPYDIIAKWTDVVDVTDSSGCVLCDLGVCDDTPTLWRDMTPEEKGALLLAVHEGKLIEAFGVGVPDSWALTYPVWDDDVAYRVKPEPKVETVTLTGFKARDYWVFSEIEMQVKDTHRINFTVTDGNMDVDSIKAEAL